MMSDAPAGRGGCLEADFDEVGELAYELRGGGAAEE